MIDTTHELGVAPPDFAEFYRRDAPGVQRFMCAFAGRELGVEATAESFARMLERWAQLRRLGDAQRRAYVLTTAKNYVRRVAVLDARFTALDGERHDVGRADTDLDLVADSTGLVQAVRRVIDGQPARRRQVALLFFLHDDSTADIARVLDMSESTVRSHVSALRKLLQPYVQRFQQIVEASGDD
ncbi:sigma-70 family RNA polymerase sigma factor [Dactylosporangium sp. NPDC005555]|uniref:RNA polymerase sigma factor n=1 Tax=Dactylosporangium sp. NPDC005555 TaxID=3154889 RepID=UPI0033B9DE2F